MAYVITNKYRAYSYTKILLLGLRIIVIVFVVIVIIGIDITTVIIISPASEILYIHYYCIIIFYIYLPALVASGSRSVVASVDNDLAGCECSVSSVLADEPSFEGVAREVVMSTRLL